MTTETTVSGTKGLRAGRFAMRRCRLGGWAMSHPVVMGSSVRVPSIRGDLVARDLPATTGGGECRCAPSFRAFPSRRVAMGDLLYVGLALAFFGLSWAFVKLCERV